MNRIQWLSGALNIQGPKVQIPMSPRMTQFHVVESQEKFANL